MKLNLVFFFIVWVAVCTAVHFLLPRGWVVAPALLGLALFFWINRDKPTKGPTTLSVVVLLVIASGLLSCQQLPVKTVATETELFPAPLMKTDSLGWTGPVLVSVH